MPGSAYHRVGVLAGHPAYSAKAGALVCPWPGCAATFVRAGEYDRHYLAHDPPPEHAWRWLSGRSWDREAARRSTWPAVYLDDQGTRPVYGHKPIYRRIRAGYGDDTEVACSCGRFAYRSHRKWIARYEFDRHVRTTVESTSTSAEENS